MRVERVPVARWTGRTPGAAERWNQDAAAPQAGLGLGTGTPTLFMRVAQAAALLFVVSLPIENVAVIPVVGSLGRLTGLIMLLTAIPLFLGRGGIRIRRMPVAIVFIGLYVLWSMAGLMWTIEPTSTTVYVTTFLQFFVFIAALWQVFGYGSGWRPIMQAYVIGCVLAVLDGVRNFAEGNEAVFLRFAVSNTDPNEYALVLALGIPMAYELFRQGRRWVRVVNLLLIPVLLVGIVLSSSRGGTIAAAVALLVFPFGLLTLDRFGRRVILALLSLGFVAVPFFWTEIASTVGTNLERISTLGDELTSGTLNERSTIWLAGVDAFSVSPIVGAGGGTFPAAIQREVGMRQVAHNTFLSVAVEMGAIGLLLFVAILIIIAVPLLRLPRAVFVSAVILLATLLVGIAPLSWEFRKPLWLVLTVLMMMGGVRLDRTALRRHAPEPAGPAPAS